MEMQLTSGSAQISYNIYSCDSAKNREAMILVHGLGMDNRYWYKLIPLLREKFTVITYDLRGHGKSTAGEEEISWDLLLRDLTNLIKELNLGQVHLVGHGLGANVAILFSYHHPNLIKTLTIMSTIIYFAPSVSRETLSYRKQLLELGSLQSLADYLIPKIIMGSTGHPDAALLYSCYSQCSASVYYQYMETLVSNPLTLEQLSKIRIPTLILTGEFDPIFPPRVTALTAFTFSNHHYSVIPQSSNITFLDQPATTAQTITDFILEDFIKTKAYDNITDAYLDEVGTHFNQIIQQGASEIETPPILQITLMDSFSVRWKGRAIEEGWNQRMAKPLFCYLVFHPTALREQVCDDLLSKVDLITAKRNLRVYLHHLKRLINLEDTPFLKTDHEHIFLTEKIDCDLVHYWNKIKDIQGQAVDLYYEDYKQLLKHAPQTILPGIFDEWAQKLRNQLQEQLIQMAEKISLYHAERKEYVAAAEYLEFVMDYDCVDDRLYERMINLYEKADDREKAAYWVNRYQADWMS